MFDWGFCFMDGFWWVDEKYCWNLTVRDEAMTSDHGGLTGGDWFDPHHSSSENPVFFISNFCLSMDPKRVMKQNGNFFCLIL